MWVAGSGDDLTEELVLGCDRVVLEEPCARCVVPCLFAPGPPGSGGCEVPGGAVVFDAEVDQPFEVDDGGPGGKRDLVAVNASMA